MMLLAARRRVASGDGRSVKGWARCQADSPWAGTARGAPPGRPPGRALGHRLLTSPPSAWECPSGTWHRPFAVDDARPLDDIRHLPSRAALAPAGSRRLASVPAVFFPLVPNCANDDVVADDLEEDDVARATERNNQFA